MVRAVVRACGVRHLHKDARTACSTEDGCVDGDDVYVGHRSPGCDAGAKLGEEARTDALFCVGGAHRRGSYLQIVTLKAGLVTILQGFPKTMAKAARNDRENVC